MIAPEYNGFSSRVLLVDSFRDRNGERDSHRTSDRIVPVENQKQRFQYCRTARITKETNMLSKETLERYRRMTTSERAAVVVQSMRENWPAMFEGTVEKVARRFELLRRQNDERNRNMLEGLSRTRSDAL